MQSCKYLHRILFWESVDKIMDCSIKNANYARVMTVIEKLLREDSRGLLPCNCKNCLNDIAATSLNFLPPHYNAEGSEEGELGSPWVMVETAVVNAIEQIKLSPHHEEEGRKDGE